MPCPGFFARRAEQPLRLYRICQGNPARRMMLEEGSDERQRQQVEQRNQDKGPAEAKGIGQCATQRKADACTNIGDRHQDRKH